MREEDLIVNCAKRIVKKLSESKHYKLNGEYPKNVQAEIAKMLGLSKRLAHKIHEK